MSIPEFAAATLSVVLGSIVQVASGVGGGFVIVPLLALVDLSLVPSPLIFASLSLSGLMAYRGRQKVDWAHIPMTLLGLIPGSIFGAYILASVPLASLGIVFGTVILMGIVLTASGLRLRLTRTTAVISGAVSGAMGTASGIGAPPLALLYQHESGPRVRGTLAALYTCASILILMILFSFGKFTLVNAWSGVQLMPGFILGYWIANRFTPHVDRGRTRIAVLIVSAAAAMVLIARSLTAS